MILSICSQSQQPVSFEFLANNVPNDKSSYFENSSNIVCLSTAKFTEKSTELGHCPLGMEHHMMILICKFHMLCQ